MVAMATKFGTKWAIT